MFRKQTAGIFAATLNHVAKLLLAEIGTGLSSRSATRLLYYLSKPFCYVFGGFARRRDDRAHSP